MKLILTIILTCALFQLRAQDMATTDQNYTGVLKPTVIKKKLYPPTLWKQCDYYEGYSSFCVYKSSVDGNLYLIGFNQDEEQILKHKIDEAEFNTQLSVCYITYNGWTIRLYNQLN